MTDIDLAALADRVEALTGPDRAIDLSITCALDRRPEWLEGSSGHLWIDGSGRYPVLRFADECIGQSTGNRSVDDPPAFTASIDAAMTLVDPADEWSLSTIYNIARAEVGINRDHQGSWPGHGEHAGCNPVLALLAAALRARLHQPEARGK